MEITFLNLKESQVQAIAELEQHLNLHSTSDAAVKVTVAEGEELSVCGTKQNVTVTYRREHELYRALSHLPDFLKDGTELHETGIYKMLCYMGDCSRNAVYNLPTAKQMIRYLALMGYDSMMLYTEDTYELPEYPSFGHMRGRYSEAELKELDDYAAMFGIELIPCIQTLAHLATALRWPDFNGYKDNDDVLLVGDERTYKFVEAAIVRCRKCFRSNRINIGMDEAFQIACGQYLKRNGYKKPSDVMLEHLEKVVAICHQYGYQPMIWSDMFFRMQFNGAYRVATGELLQEVVDKVPNGVDLVYWDYYSMNVELFSHMLDCHGQFRNPVLFAGGAWKWYGFGAHNRFSLKSSKMQLDECAKRGIDRIIVTSWGDDGAEASQFSAIASVLYFAERCYCKNVDDSWLDRRALQCLQIGFDDLLAFDLPDELPETSVDVTDVPTNPGKYLLYNDPLERLADCHYCPETAGAAYAEHAERLMALKGQAIFGYAFETLGCLCSILAVKCDLGTRLYQAYQAKDVDAIKTIANTDIPSVIANLEQFIDVFRRQWYRENKTFGFVTQEIRLGGLLERMRSVKQRLESFLNGTIDRIEELEYAPVPLLAKQQGKYVKLNTWHKDVTAGVL